jgi:hypothetical protein
LKAVPADYFIGMTLEEFIIRNKDYGTIKGAIPKNRYVKECYWMDECDDCYNISVGKRTPLMYACWQGTVKIIELLLDNGANPKIIDDGGGVALSYLEKNEKLSLNEKTLIRKRLAFQKWHHFDNRIWNQILREARAKIVPERYLLKEK